MGASVSTSAPLVKRATWGNIADGQSVPAKASSVSATAPLDASAAVETELFSKTSSRRGWHTLLFLVTALPAAGMIIYQRRVHGSFALTKVPESIITIPLLRKFRGGLAEGDMTGYQLQTRDTEHDVSV